MIQPKDSSSSPPSSASSGPFQLRFFLIALVALSLAFFKPLGQLVELSLNSELYSHLLLIPIVSAYFVWIRKDELPTVQAPRKILAIIPALLAALLLGVYLNGGAPATIDDALAQTTASFVLFIYAIALYCFGINTLAKLLFPLGFLLFLIPFPSALQAAINTFFQYTSAEVSHFMVKSIGIPVFRPDPLTFELPTIELHVAPSCSGIRSSLVLLITSVVAGELFLQSKWKRVFLVFFVIPLAIVRNGFRIFTLSYLCTNVGPHMINHWIHHKGGPIFFVLSLIPFFALLFWLWKRDRLSSRRLIGRLEN